jgi:ribonuclease Z
MPELAGYILPMSLAIRFLGTSASRPTVERNVSSLALVRDGETMLFDCGEGTQRQMMRYGISFNVGDIFFTHTHADHLLGVIGLLRTMSLQGRSEPLRLWGPKGSARTLRRAEQFGMDRLTFPVEIAELLSGASMARKGYAIAAFAVDHGPSASLGYALLEEERRGRFHPDMARQLGIPEGPLWGRLHRGERVTLEDGRVIDPATLVGTPRPGRRVVISGDTRPCEVTVEMASGADLLVHEATFGEEEAARAMETGHSTAAEAARVAERAAVRQLVLTHFSARYSRDASELEREARAIFANVSVARDGTEIDVAYGEEDTAAADRVENRTARR